MTLVDILDVIPPEKTELLAPILAIIPELAESLVRHQDATGVWFQIVDMPDESGNYREASQSAMFAQDSCGNSSPASVNASSTSATGVSACEAPDLR